MTNRELATTLKQIKNERRGGAPHDVWVERNRDILLMQVRNTTDVHAKPELRDTVRHFFSIFIPTESILMAARAVGVFLLVIGTVLSGGLASAQIYDNAAPGELLYNVKLAVEDAQIFLAPNEEYRSSLHAEFADRRLDEVAKLSDMGEDHQALVPSVLVAFNGEVAALSASMETLRSQDPNGVLEVAKLMERKMTIYQNELAKVGSTLAPQYQSSLAESQNLVDDTTIKAIAVIVEKHLADANSVPSAVVDTKFAESIQQDEANLDAAPPTDDAQKIASATKAKAAIAEAKQLVKDEDYEAALTKIEEVAQLTKEVQAGSATTPAPSMTTPPTTNAVTPALPVTDGGAATSAKTDAVTTPTTNVNVSAKP
jgi:hypothetical protein